MQDGQLQHPRWSNTVGRRSTNIVCTVALLHGNTSFTIVFLQHVTDHLSHVQLHLCRKQHHQPFVEGPQQCASLSRGSCCCGPGGMLMWAGGHECQVQPMPAVPHAAQTQPTPVMASTITVPQDVVSSESAPVPAAEQTADPFLALGHSACIAGCTPVCPVNVWLHSWTRQASAHTPSACLCCASAQAAST